MIDLRAHILGLQHKWAKQLENSKKRMDEFNPTSLGMFISTVCILIVVSCSMVFVQSTDIYVSHLLNSLTLRIDFIRKT